MTKNPDGSVTLTAAEWRDLKVAFKCMDNFFAGAPFTFEDMLTKREEVAYHKSEALVAGKKYNPEDWS